MSKQKLATALDNIIEVTDPIQGMDGSLADEYKKLSEKCDTVISKIKDRKRKKPLKQS